MGTKASLTLGAFAILVLLIAAVSYWALRENSHSAPPASNLAEAPPAALQNRSGPENSPPLQQEKQTADAPPQTPSTAPAAPGPVPSPPPNTAGQSKEVPTPPSSPSTAAPPEQSRQMASEKPPSAAMTLAMPDEDKMSEANRRQVQETLHGLGYYNGPVDGIFGPLTRASIRRFQDRIGAEQTGRLTAAEAGRLVSGTGLEPGARTQGDGGLGTPAALVGHHEPKPADLSPREEQGNVPVPYNLPAVARGRGTSKRDNGGTGNAGAYGQIPNICTGC
jgi:peptidoglycan hydrolase-like protein with peptidoglycan-binding domain